ncbi:MAG: FAD-binding oxidoreductase [Peptococcaceae bacterium]
MNKLALNEVFPNSSAEAQSMIGKAGEEKISVYPLGGGTKIQLVLPEITGGTILNTKELNKVVEYRPDNMSIEVEAGMKIQNLNEFLKTDNLFFPVDNNKPAETVGGVVASNSRGRKTFLYKSARHYVLGLEFISPAGEVVKVGGRTIKNVSGYDISQLLAGSWGHLGLITKVTLRLKPLPQKKLIMEYRLSGYEEMQRIIAQITSGGYRLAALCQKSLGAETALQVELEGLNDIVDIQADMLEKDYGFYKTDTPLELQDEMMYRVILDLDHYVKGLKIVRNWSTSHNIAGDFQGIVTNGILEFNIAGAADSGINNELGCSLKNIGGTLYYQNNEIIRTEQQAYQKLLLNIKQKVDPQAIFMTSSRLLKE